MNDYEMIHLAHARSHDFRREADQHRLARLATLRTASRPGSQQRLPHVPRSALRLTLDYLLGRAGV
jgi:hypothetical protein